MKLEDHPHGKTLKADWRIHLHGPFRLPVSKVKRSLNQPVMWLRPPKRYSFVPTATSDAAALGGGGVPEHMTFCHDSDSVPNRK